MKTYGSISITKVEDGTGIKKVNTHVRTQTLAWWEEHADPTCTDKNWTTGTDYDNSHIKSGDIAYIVGKVSDAVGVNGLAVDVALYGVVETVTSSHVIMTPSHLIMGGAKGDDGAPVEVESQVEQYCFGEIPTDNSMPVAPSESDTGWSATMLSPWEVVDGKKTKTHHVWKRTKTDWSNGQTTYVGVTLMSDFDIANILAQQAGTSIGEWCKAQNVTIIDGSTIMTGSIAAAQIASDAIETKHIKADAVTADRIKVDNLAAINANLGTLTAGTIDASKVTVLNLNADNITAGTIDAERIDVPDLKAIGATIGGWDITENGIEKKDAEGNLVGMYSGSDSSGSYASLVNSSTTSPVRFCAGGDIYVSNFEYFTKDGYESDPAVDAGKTIIYPDCEGGMLVDVNILKVEILFMGGDDGTNDVTSNISTPTIDSENNSFTFNQVDYDSSNDTLCVYYEYTYRIGEGGYAPAFKVLEDGSLYANAVQIGGRVKANSGFIGDLEINDGSLRLVENSTSEIQIGDVSFGYNPNSSLSYIETSGPFALRGQNETGLCFMQNDKGSSVTGDVEAYCKSTLVGSVYVYDVYLSINEECLYDFSVTVNYRFATQNNTQTAIQSRIFEFKSGNRVSDTETLFYSSAETGITVPLANLVGIKFQGYDGTWSSVVKGEDSSNYYTSAAIVGSINQKEANNYIEVKGHLIPQVNSTAEGAGYKLGISTQQWDNVYARRGDFGLLYSDSGTVDGSDRNIKKDIEALPDAYGELFDSLEPVRYKYKENTSDRYHTGFIAPDVLGAVENAGLTSKDFAAYCAWEKEDGETTSGLRYSEFIALCVSEIQKLKKRVNELEEKLDTTK